MKKVTYKIEVCDGGEWKFARDGDHDIEIPLYMATAQLREVAVRSGCKVRLIRIEESRTVITEYSYN